MAFLLLIVTIRNRLVIESSSFLRISTPNFLSPLLEGPQKFLELRITNCKFENITGNLLKIHSREINDATGRIVISNCVFSSSMHTLAYYHNSMFNISILFLELHIVNCSFKEITTGFAGDMLYIETPIKSRTAMKVFVKECAFSEVTPGTNWPWQFLINFPISEQVLDLQITECSF